MTRFILILPFLLVPASCRSIMSGVEEEARLLYCLERLPDEPRNIIVLREFERKGWDEIATIMGRANSTVRLKYRSGWLQLSRCMAAEPE